MVVVGGGLAGLVTARALATAGVDVTVCEAASVLGGKLRLAEVAGHRVDVGAEAMLAVRPEGVDLLRDLGAADELVSPTTTSASIWSRVTAPGRNRAARPSSTETTELSSPT